jgi:hypothetical protein
MDDTNDYNPCLFAEMSKGDGFYPCEKEGPICEEHMALLETYPPKLARVMTLVMLGGYSLTANTRVTKEWHVGTDMPLSSLTLWTDEEPDPNQGRLFDMAPDTMTIKVSTMVDWDDNKDRPIVKTVETTVPTEWIRDLLPNGKG